MPNTVSNNQNQNHITVELKNRLLTAKKNGNEVAEAILDRFNEHFDELPEEAKIQTFTSKRITNRGRTVNVQIIGTRENGTRTTYSIAEFAHLVLPANSENLSDEKLCKFTDDIKISSRMKASQGRGFKFMRKIFFGDNFSDERTMECSLNKSYVNNYSFATMYAHFYTDIVPCRAIIVKDKTDKIMARAVVYDNVTFSKRNHGEFTGSFLSRVYYTANAAKDYLINYAKKLGILVYQANQDPISNLLLLSPPESEETATTYTNILNSYGGPVARIKMNMTWRYKSGMPFIDMFKFTACRDNALYLETADYGSDYTVVGFNQNVEGVMSLRNSVCPICGTIMPTSEQPICDNCSSDGGVVSTLFGDFLSMETKSVPHWGRVPKGCVVNNRISDSAILAIMLNRFSSEPPTIPDPPQPAPVPQAEATVLVVAASTPVTAEPPAETTAYSGPLTVDEQTALNQAMAEYVAEHAN